MATKKETDEVVEAEVEKAKTPPVGPQVSEHENFTVNLLPTGALEISPRPWEGPAGLVTTPSKVAELINVLKQYI